MPVIATGGAISYAAIVVSIEPWKIRVDLGLVNPQACSFTQSCLDLSMVSRCSPAGWLLYLRRIQIVVLSQYCQNVILVDPKFHEPFNLLSYCLPDRVRYDRSLVALEAFRWVNMFK